MTVLLWIMPSEGYGTYLVLVVLVLSILLALLLVSTLLFIIGLVVYVLLPCLTLDLLFALILLTVLTPVVQTLLVMYGTTHCKSSSDHIAIGNLLTEIPLYSHFHPSFQPQWTRSNCISCCMFTILYTPIFAPYINGNKWRWLSNTYAEDCSWTTSSGQSEMPSRIPTTLVVNCRYVHEIEIQIFD